MNKFYCGPRHTLSIVYYIAASMGYSQEETKRVVGKIENDKEMNEFQKILTEPFYSMQNVEFNGETMDIIEPFNLAERIQMVIDLILKKTDLVPLIKDSVAARYRNSPFRFSNFVRNPKEEPVMKAEPKMTAREEYLRDEAEIEKFDEERLEELKQLDELVKQRVEEELQKRENLEKERLEMLKIDEALRNRTEEEAMISRSIEIYPSTNLCKDSLNTGNFKNPSDFKGLFSFVRVDGDRLYRINDSSVQPWNRNKPLGTIRMISENFGLFTATKLIIKVNEDAVEEYVDEYFDNPYVILDAVNSKYGYSITPEDISVDQVFGTPSLETPNRYLFRHSYYRVADEVKASLKESRNKFIKGLVRDSAIVVLNDKELYDWIKGKNPTNS